MAGYRWSRKSGNALIEFTFVVLPVMFVIISIFEVARGMWMYNSLAYALRQATRYVIVHGNNCTIPPNSCRVQIGDIATVIRYNGVGLSPADVDLQFISSAGASIPASGWVTLENCLPPSGAQSSTFWPASAPGAALQDARGGQGVDAEIRGRVRFTSAITLFWPGVRTMGTFGQVRLPANSRGAVIY